MAEDAVEDLDVRILTRRVGSLNPHQIASKYVDAELISERRLASIFVGCKGIPPCGSTLLRDPEVRTIYSHGTVVAHIVSPLTCSQI